MIGKRDPFAFYNMAYCVIQRHGFLPARIIHWVGIYSLHIQSNLMAKDNYFLLFHSLVTLGYRLSNEGCDVWLANTRGTVYSMNHTTINPFGTSKERKTFWSFSFHEMGIYDLPAIIDYVLLQTKVSKLHFIGHSQGTAAFFVMASEKPEYNEKIEIMHALAPIAFLKHVVSPPLRALAPFVFSAKVC